MSQNTVLKKQFLEKDVERLRNLMTGKYGEKVSQSVGYKKPDITRNEGDIWEEKGREWTVKNGIKQNITKLDKAKSKHLIPLFCPQCKSQMKKRLDPEYYRLHRTCFSCVVDKEHQIQKDGNWDEYQRNIKNDEIDNKIKDFKQYVEDKLNESNDGYVSEQGDKERWKGKLDESRIDDHVTSVIDYLESLKK
jgi:hypothetical protein|tara:strand:- start:649 stop:1224 length:576 start_codon:yes stop_codon:yes gene_type:complete